MTEASARERDAAPRISEWEGDVVLADGATVHMRALRPDDEPLLARMYERLSANSVYFRFFSPVPRATATSLEMNRLGTAGHAARVAVLGGEIVAAARYDVVSDGVAEVAFVVADEHQGRGVGTLLLEHLAVIARSQGIHTFAADTLPDNANMLGMFAAAGWPRETHFQDGNDTNPLLHRAQRGGHRGDRRPRARGRGRFDEATAGAAHGRGDRSERGTREDRQCGDAEPGRPGIPRRGVPGQSRTRPRSRASRPIRR